ATSFAYCFSIPWFLRRHLHLPDDLVDGPGELADLVLDQSVCDGVSDAGRSLPAPVGACIDRKALLAQDAENRLDCIALGASRRGTPRPSERRIELPATK